MFSHTFARIFLSARLGFSFFLLLIVGLLSISNQAVAQSPDLGQYQQVRYVSISTGSDVAGVGSQAQPWQNLDFALSQINDASSTKVYAVLIAAGTYTGTGASAAFVMKPWVDLYGSYSESDWSRNISSNKTILDGQRSRRVVISASNVLLDGFTITRGIATNSNGGGIYINNVQSVTISNTKISSNTATYNGDWNGITLPPPSGAGGGILSHNSSVQLNSCQFSDNNAFVGGCIFSSCYSASPGTSSPVVEIRKCSFTDSNAHSGGGLYCYNSSTIVDKCSFNNNTTNYGGGVYCDDGSSAIIQNSIFYRNTSLIAGSAIRCFGSFIELYNSVFLENYSPGNVISDYVNSSTFSLRNSIVWENDTNGFDGNVNVRHCSVQGGHTGEGNFDLDPFFVDPENGDFHLQANSLCIDAGVGPAIDQKVPIEDIDGDARFGETCDIGVDEYPQPSPTPTPTPDPENCNHCADMDYNCVISTYELLSYVGHLMNEDPGYTTSCLLYAAVIWKRGGIYSDYEAVEVSLPGLSTDARPLKMVRIPAGTFLMGNTGTERDQNSWCIECEYPRHEVTIDSDFFISETEITQAQWREVMGTNPSEGYGVGDDYPVYNVSWDDCQSFVNALNARNEGYFRLPTEAEWEYACRGSAANPNRYDPFSFGDDPGIDLSSCNFSQVLDQYMWWCGNWGDPSPLRCQVAQKSPNDYGLYDMHGNCWEWCLDWWQADFYSTPEATRPSPVCINNASGYHVLRGGTWGFLARDCRSSVRYSSALLTNPDYRNNTVSFRIVMTAPDIVPIDLPNLPNDAVPLRIVRIPAGTFLMGNSGNPRDTEVCFDWCGGDCTCEFPQHEVTISHDFYIGEAEITQAQWYALMNTNPASGFGVGPNLPVYNVSWNDCQSFINVLNTKGLGIFRLPTEAEWEYAYRGPSSNPNRYDLLPFGDDPTYAVTSCEPNAFFDKYVVWCGNTNVLGEVGSKLPNAFGLHMEGNLSEWCQDWYQEDFYSQPEATLPDPVCLNPESGYRVLRGGGYNGSIGNHRSAMRVRYEPGTQSTVGFRIVRE